jgi:hypothetical protein
LREGGTERVPDVETFVDAGFGPALCGFVGAVRVEAAGARTSDCGLGVGFVTGDAGATLDSGPRRNLEATERR